MPLCFLTFGGISLHKNAKLFLTFAKIGAFTFGGGYAMLSLIEHECVTKEKWISEDELVNLSIVAESTPGPIAINCSTYVGYQQNGLSGAICATLGMVLPSFLIIMLISSFMKSLLSVPIIAAAFKGIRIAVGVLIMQAAIRMTKNVLKKSEKKAVSMALVFLFFAVMTALNVLNIPFSTIYLICIAALFGLALFLKPSGKEAQG